MAENFVKGFQTDKGVQLYDYNALANKPTPIELDSTLKVEGKAADAKAVGNALGNKLGLDQLQSAINNALTQAKASGEFDGENGKSAYAYAQDGGYTGTEGEFAEKLALEPLIGITDNITPVQVVEAMVVGRPVIIVYNYDSFGEFAFTSFCVIMGDQNTQAVYSTYVIVTGDGDIGVLGLFGNLEVNEWEVFAEPMPDIPTDEHINQLIDNKLKSSGGNVDLTGYATQQWVQDQNYLKSIPSDYVTSGELTGEVNSALAQAKDRGDFKGDPGDDYVLTEADKQEIANMIQIPDLPDSPSSENKVLIIDASGDKIAYSSSEIIELVKQGYNISLRDDSLIYTLNYTVESDNYVLFSSTSYLGNLLIYASIEVESDGQLYKYYPTVTQLFNVPPSKNANHILKASSSGVDWVNLTNEVVNIVTENFTNVAEVGA